MPRTFRLQLTIFYLALFSLLFGLFSIFVYGGLSRSLEARIQETVASEADTAAGIFLDEFAETKGDFQASADETVNAMKLRGDAIAVLDGKRVLAGKSTIPAGGRHTVASRDVGAAGRIIRIQVSGSLAPVEETQRAALRVILIGLPLVLALAGLGGYLLATRTLRPFTGS